MELDLEDKDKLILFLIYPAVLGSLSLLLGIIYTESGYLKLAPRTGELAIPSMVIPLVFGYLNLVISPILLNLYKKGSPFRINLILGGSFSLTTFINIVLALVLFLISEILGPDRGLIQSYELKLIISFSSYGIWGAWLIGGFVYVWWRTSKDYTPDTRITYEARAYTTGLLNTQTTCEICRKKIIFEDEKINCPNCNKSFHFEHFAEWVKMKGICPNCKERVHL